MKKLMKSVSNTVTKFMNKIRSIFKLQEKNEPELGRVSTKSDHYWRVDRKKEQLLQKLDKSIQKKRRMIQCDCTHKTEDGYTLRLVKGRQGEVTFVCSLCGKKVIANRVPPVKLMEAIKVLDMATDAIKLDLNLEKDTDVKIARYISDLQYRALYSIFPLYAATQGEGYANELQPDESEEMVEEEAD